MCFLIAWGVTPSISAISRRVRPMARSSATNCCNSRQANALIFSHCWSLPYRLVNRGYKHSVKTFVIREDCLKRENVKRENVRRQEPEALCSRFHVFTYHERLHVSRNVFTYHERLHLASGSIRLVFFPARYRSICCLRACSSSVRRLMPVSMIAPAASATRRASVVGLSDDDSPRRGLS